MSDIRQKLAWGIGAGVVLALVVFGVVRLLTTETDDYEGLTLWRETQMDETTKLTIEQRLSTTRASIVALEERGEEVSAKLYEALAYDAYLLGDLVTSREAYEQVLNNNPLYYVAWNSYGSVLDAMGDYEGAERAYLQAIDQGQIEEYYVDFAQFLERRFPERDEDVKTVLEQGVDVVGRTQRFMVMLGEWYAEHGDCDRAVAHYEVALTLNPAAAESIRAAMADARVRCKETAQEE